MHVLVIEDSRRLREALGKGLKKSGFSVDLVGDGPTGLVYATKNPYDVIVLDLMLPGLHGMQILKAVREKGLDVNVLILTARDEVESRVEGLSAGADDYLTKPFTFEELIARLNALVRRKYGSKTPTIRIGELEVDTVAHKAICQGKEIALSAREYSLLEYLAFRKDQVVTRIEIQDHVYDEHTLPVSNAVDSGICTLRAKLAKVTDQPLIHTRRNQGYVLGEDAK